MHLNARFHNQLYPGPGKFIALNALRDVGVHESDVWYYF